MSKVISKRWRNFLMPGFILAGAAIAVASLNPERCPDGNLGFDSFAFIFAIIPLTYEARIPIFRV